MRKIDPKRNKEEQERPWEATMVSEVRNGGDLDQVGGSESRQKWMDWWWDARGRCGREE